MNNMQIKLNKQNIKCDIKSSELFVKILHVKDCQSGNTNQP